jgi:hypothetical protein
MDNDFRAPLVDGDSASQFHLSSFQSVQAAELIPFGSKNYAREGTGAIIRAEIQKGVSGAGSENA